MTMPNIFLQCLAKHDSIVINMVLDKWIWCWHVPNCFWSNLYFSSYKEKHTPYILKLIHEFVQTTQDTNEKYTCMPHPVQGQWWILGYIFS